MEKSTTPKAPCLGATQINLSALFGDSLPPILCATMIRLPDVMRRIGKKRSAIYEDIQVGLFPPPVSIGSRAVAWPDYEVVAINAARIAGKTLDEIRNLVATLVTARNLSNGEVAK